MSTLNVGLYVLLRLAAFLLPVVPLPVAYAIAHRVGTLAFYVLPAPRRALLDNLAHVFGEPPSSPRVHAAAKTAFQNDAKNWIDTVRIARLTDEEILAAAQVDGWEYLEQARSQSRGVVLVGLHLGNFDLVGQVLAIRGYRVTVPVEHMRPERLFTYLMRSRTARGINAVPPDRAPREMLRALRAGEIVAIVGDRYLGGRGIRVPLFGAEATLPRGPASLASHTGAPLVVGVGIRQSTDRFRGYIRPVIIPADESMPVRNEVSVASRLACVMESFIREFPDQWIVFSRVWSSPDTDADHAGTMKQSGPGGGVMTGARS